MDDIKLDKSVEDVINQTYSIDSSVLRELEQRRQLVESSKNSTRQILKDAPTQIEEPVETDSTITNIENDLEYQYKLKERELDSILGLLTQLDVKIDKIDSEIQKIESSALPLIDEINNQINKVKAAYDFRVTAGCVSDLEWVEYSENELIQAIFGPEYNLSYYVPEKSQAQKIENNYYGIKYYQKPSNRDYGYTVIVDFDGSIQVGINSLAVLTSNTIDSIQIGDKIADNVDTPKAFGLGEFATVVGFGSTDVLGITTAIIGSVSIGSSVIALSGIGSTEDIKIGNYAVNENLFDNNTKVVGFGTTVITISYIDPGASSIITDNIIVPSIITDNNSIGLATDVQIGFGTYTNYPCLNLDLSSNLKLENAPFTVIRLTEDITEDFDYTKTPLDPVKVGIADSYHIGLGHKAVLVNNGESSAVKNWKEVQGKKEPKVGNDKATYYIGVCSWPCITTPDFIGYGTTTYAIEGQIYRLSAGQGVLYSDVSPTGINTNGAACVSYASSIVTEEAKLEEIKLKNLGRINQLVSASNALRISRDDYELKAWGYLQSAAYTRQKLNEISSNLNAIRSVDYQSL